MTQAKEEVGGKKDKKFGEIDCECGYRAWEDSICLKCGKFNHQSSRQKAGV